MRDGADVVFQATFFDGRSSASPTSSSARPTSRRPLGRSTTPSSRATPRSRRCCSSPPMRSSSRRAGSPVGPTVHLLLGDGTPSSHRLDDIRPVFRQRMARLRAARSTPGWQDEPARSSGAPRASPPAAAAPSAPPRSTAPRDVLLVGRLRTVNQRARLRDGRASPRSTSSPRARGRSTASARRPCTPAPQAAAAARAGGRPTGAGRHRVEAEVIDPEGLAALPPSRSAATSSSTSRATRSGRGRLGRPGVSSTCFGVVEADGTASTFRPFWAHDRAEEKQALLDFLDYVAAPASGYPDLHIYHYADYERSHLQQLCARHGVGEAILDDLLRDDVFVDLYPIVLRTIRISEPLLQPQEARAPLHGRAPARAAR